MPYDLVGIKAYKFGGAGKVTVGNTATLVLDANYKRLSFTIVVHPSAANNVWFWFDNTVTTDDGLPVVPGGTIRDQGEGCWMGAIYAIASADTSVYVIEKYRDGGL